MWRTSWVSHANARTLEAVEQLDEARGPVGVVHVDGVDSRFGELAPRGAPPSP